MGSAVQVVKVPDVGEGITEVELVAWFVAVGQTVERNQVLAEVMTDKANVEIPSPTAGTIAGLNGVLGSKLAVGSALIELSVGDGVAVPGSDPGPEPAGADPVPPTDSSAEPPTEARTGAGPATPQAAPAGPAAAPASGPPAHTAGSSGDGRRPLGPPRAEGERPRATPAVRARAREAGVDLRQVAGSGPAGRITHDDLAAFLTGTSAPIARPTPSAAPDDTTTDQPVIGIRRQISERMVASTTTIPHITYVEEVDVTALEALRASLNERRHPDQTRLTILPFLVRALVVALPRFPHLNAHLLDPEPDSEQPATLRTFGAVNVGIATQTDNGLLVPVVHQAQTSSIWDLAAQVAARATSAREGRATPTELRGSTITITSLGALGGLVTTPVINKPEVAIVGVNKIATRPVWADGGFVPRQMMNLSSSFDHRVVDGWDAATFVQELRTLLEQPALLFVGSP